MDLRLGAIILFSLFFSACTYNPFISDNHLTGSPTAGVIGAGAGAGSVALLGGSKPFIALAGITGGMFGYYVTTLRYDSGGILQAGGTVYKVGDFVGIDIPTDKLFEPNSSDFLPQAHYILDSVVEVLERYPKNSIFISGNTSGFSRPRWELKLSEKRAQRVSAYLWDAGINNFENPGIDTRSLRYVGYGNYFPIARDLTNNGIRANSRIQITSYPDACRLQLGARDVAMSNYGADIDDRVAGAPDCHSDGGGGMSEGNNC